MSDDRSYPGAPPRRPTGRRSGLSALHGELADPLPPLDIPSEPPAPAPPPMAEIGTEPPPDDAALLRGDDFGKWAEPEAPTRSIDTMVGKVVDDRYEIKRMIGRGGMGAVFEAFQPSVQRTVALKVLLREFAENETVIKRFHKEALAASRLTHPNTISVYDFGQTDDGILFIAMEYLRGEDLAALLGRHQGMPVGRVLRIMRQVCKSLSEAHKAGIIHRDLKPDNVFLTDIEGEDDFVKVLDFGVAKIREGDGGERTLTQAGTMFGTPKYMSPEQTRSTKLDARSDIYSLGVILYEMLMGEPPFVSDNPLSILIAHVNEFAATFADRRPDLEIDPAVEAVVFQALQKDREDRQPDVDTLLDQIEALIELEGGAARATLAGRLPDPALFGIGGAAAAEPVEIPDIADVVLDDGPTDARRDERKSPIVPIIIGVLALAGAGFVLFGMGEPEKPTENPTPVASTPPQPTPVPDPKAVDPAPPPAPKAVPFVITTQPLGVTILRKDGDALTMVGATSKEAGGGRVELELTEATTYIARLDKHFDQEFKLDPATAVDDKDRLKHLAMTRSEPDEPKPTRAKPRPEKKGPRTAATPPVKVQPAVTPKPVDPGPIELPPPPAKDEDETPIDML